MSGTDNKPMSFISFDVEALPLRADRDHFERLIWGKFNGAEFGVGRISSILKQHGIKGNFLIDFASCLLYGDKAVNNVADYLLGQGHEVHVHLHSELVIPKWGLQSDRWHSMVGMDQVDGALSRSLLEFAAFKYRLLVGSDPMLFRSGSYRFNSATIEAATHVGYKVCSNFNSERHAASWSTTNPRALNNEVFRWNEKLVELPVDFSPEPLAHDWQMYEDHFRLVLERKTLKTFNLTLHSWSLLTRGGGQYFTGHAPAHEERLHKICEHLNARTTPLGYNDFASRGAVIPEVRDLQCKLVPGAVTIPSKRCTICGAVYGLVLADDICTSCGARARHREILDVLSRTGNPFAGRRVLACHANPIEKQAFLADAAEVVNFDIRPVGYVGLQMDIQSMDKIEDNSFDAFVAIHVLNHVSDDRKALQEIRRVLKPGGVALVTVSCKANTSTSPCDNVSKHYGAEALNKYGVGTYRIYGLQDILGLFGEFFAIRNEKGVDRLTDSSGFVFFLTKPDDFASSL